MLTKRERRKGMTGEEISIARWSIIVHVVGLAGGLDQQQQEASHFK